MTRKYGVEVNGFGGLEISEERLKKYYPILEQCKEDAVTKYMFSMVYPGSGWNIYNNKDFLDNYLYPQLNTTIDWLIENKIYPDDILDKREPKIYTAELGKIKDENNDKLIYVLLFDLPVKPDIILSDTSRIYQGLINKIKCVTAWTLVDNKGKDLWCTFIIVKSKRKKLEGGKIMTELGIRVLTENTPTAPYRFFTEPENIQKIGTRIKINTEWLGKYDPLKYILEKY